MSKNFPYELWISTGSDAGISFATVGRLARDSSMMQGILLSLQSLMTTEVNVENSQFMTGENEFVKFGTFTMTEESDNVIVQYVVKSDQANKLSKKDEQLVQELALSFCRYIILTPNFHQNLASGKMISLDYVSKSFSKACTIAKQKISVPVNNKGLVAAVGKHLENIEKKIDQYPTLQQLQNLKEWLGEDETTWDKGSILPFKRQLLVQMVAQDILNQIIVEDPFSILEYETPRYVIEETRNEIDKYLRKKEIEPEELIKKYVAKDISDKLSTHVKKLNINQIHSANTFISNSLAQEVVFRLAKENPILGLFDFRDVPLYTTIQKQIDTTADVPNPGTMICDALIEDVSPQVLQSARLFFQQLIGPFRGKNLPPSIWNVIVDFTFSIVEEKKVKKKAKESSPNKKSSIEFKRGLLKDRIAKLSVIQPKWLKELTDKFMKLGIGKQLQISNIEESVLFANALERSIISTLEKIIKDQLFNSNLGDIFVYMIDKFKDIAPKTVLVNILSRVTQDIKNRGYETAKQMSLSARELIGSAIEEGEIKSFVNSVPVQLKRSFFKGTYLRFDGRSISSTELLQKPGITLSMNGKILSLREIEQDAELLTICFKNEKVLKRAYSMAILRGMIESYLQQMFQFEGEVINQIDTLITVFNKEMVSKLRPAHRLPDINNSFPSFPLIRDVPQRFTGKRFHDKCQESWNQYAPEIHVVIQNILNGFSALRTNDLNYKRKAKKLYSNAIKQLKYIRKCLIKDWNPLNDQMTKMVERWSKDVSIDLSGHLDEVSKNANKWIGDAFKILKLDYGKFTMSHEQCNKQIVELLKQTNPKDLEELPKNFIEIATSILLYRRIPDYVIDESYNALLGEKKISDSIMRAWSKSRSRTEFENNLYLNMRVLGNTFTKMINTYGRLISTLFIQNDLALLSDIQGIYIVLGKISKAIYSTKADVLSILQFPNVEAVSVGEEWEVRLYLEPEYIKEINQYRDKLIVFSDVVGFVARIKFDENTGPVLDGIKAVISYLMEHGETNIIDLSETIKEALFRISEYPTQLVEEKQKKQ